MSYAKPSADLAGLLLRAAHLCGAKTDMELARELDVKPQSVANWRARNTIPYETMLKFSHRHRVTLDYLLLGREPKYVRRTEIDARLLSHIGTVIDAIPFWGALTRFTRYFYIGLVYNRLLRLPEDLRFDAVVGEVEFMTSVIQAREEDPIEVERTVEKAKAKQRPSQ